jgi:hypothetical protein
MFERTALLTLVAAVAACYSKPSPSMVQDAAVDGDGAAEASTTDALAETATDAAVERLPRHCCRASNVYYVVSVEYAQVDGGYVLTDGGLVPLATTLDDVQFYAVGTNAPVSQRCGLLATTLPPEVGATPNVGDAGSFVVNVPATRDLGPSEACVDTNSAGQYGTWTCSASPDQAPNTGAQCGDDGRSCAVGARCFLGDEGCEGTVEDCSDVPPGG